jgi:putative glutamine amidotransferase
MQGSMSHSPTSGNRSPTPRIGIPWRTTKEQQQGERNKLDDYFRSVIRAGAQPLAITLDQAPVPLAAQLSGLDGFVLPGSPTDIDPSRYGATKHPETNELDGDRDRTDLAILDHAFATAKPVLAICFGCQVLNVYLQGTLIQDLRTERPESIAHGDTDLPSGVTKRDIEHSVDFVGGSVLARLNGTTAGKINSSHHQAIDKPGDNLRVTAKAADGTAEGVEWTGGANWVVGVQWHPERLPDDVLSQRLFAEFVAAAARSARDSIVQKA